MFEPSPAEFVPSQQRGPDVAVYRIPDNPDLCYEWSFKKLLSDKETASYNCCGCRSLKARDGLTFKAPLPLCKIRDGYFVTDPCNPVRAHFCTPRSTPEVAMRRMVIKKCNDLREDFERRPTSSVVNELFGEVAGEGLEENVFQNQMKCALCENEQSRASFAPIPSKKVATIILLSCLARYNVITLEDAKKHYKDVFVSRKRVCKNHFIQAVMFLGWEIEQLSGEFPLNGISEAPAIVMNSLLVHLRKYRGLLDDTMPMEKKDVREFFNEYMVEFRDEITQRISTPNSPEEELFLKANANFDLKKEEESTSQIVIKEQLPETSGCLPNEARLPRFIPMKFLQLLKERGDLIDKDVVLNATDVASFFRECLNKYHNGKEWELVEEMETSSQQSAPTTCVGRRIRVRKRPYEEEEEPGVQPKTLMLGKTAVNRRISTTTRNSNYKDLNSCVVCCCKLDRTEFYRVSPQRDQNLILLSCLVLNGSFKTEVAQVMFREITKEDQYVCKKHYMLAMVYIYKSTKEKWNQLATPSFCALPVYIRVDLVDRISQCANQIQKSLVSFFSAFLPCSLLYLVSYQTFYLLC
ncbi:hypothetical protein ANCCAN_15993 [Ancylostoma caninum]|uniref:Lin-15A/B-like domain-containing protein n=1 Tax=Ancylostoma caninum TaxID=29170 RepID=A0A368G533_ANCCA|nr:hypothetical protein ANCCAN_15993 [Ancylostoma caninum]